MEKSEYIVLTLPKPPRQALEEYRTEGYPEGLRPIVDALLDIYERLENVSEVATRTASHPSLLGPFA